MQDAIERYKSLGAMVLELHKIHIQPVVDEMTALAPAVATKLSGFNAGDIIESHYNHRRMRITSMGMEKNGRWLAHGITILKDGNEGAARTAREDGFHKWVKVES